MPDNYATAGNAGFRISSWTFGAVTLLGKVRCLIEKIVQFEPVFADANNFPEIKSVDFVDARATLESLDNLVAQAESATAANLTLNFSEANGSGSGGVVIGAMKPGSVTHTQRRQMGGFGVAQVYELSGTLTYTPTN
jgi:hypothetical protein